MKRTNRIQIGAVLMAAAFALPALADTQFRIRRMTRDDVPLGKGQCDIRLQVDNEAEVAVRGDRVLIRTFAGREPYDDGSECNMPLPDRPMPDFNFEVRDSRGDIRLIEEPSRRNGFAAIVRIRDSSGGQGRYHFRLSWEERAMDMRGDDRPGRGGSGFVWNNTLNFRGRGNGRAAMNGFDQRLGNVNVDIDRSGHLIVAFRGERGRELVFTGRVMQREGGRLRADVSSEDRRFRGPMFLSLGDRENVNAITFEGGDGRDRMRLNWDRR